MYNLKNQILYSLETSDTYGRSVEGIIADIRTNGEIHGDLLHSAFVEAALKVLTEEGHVRSCKFGGPTAWKLSA